MHHNDLKIQVTRAQPVAQPIIKQAAAVYIKHTRPWFVGLLVHGSAVKGGFIAGCSDIDFHLYLEPEAFDTQRRLPIRTVLALHQDLLRIAPQPFQYLQCEAISGQSPPGYVGPIPNTYELVAGHLPVSEATAEDLIRSARYGLESLDPVPQFVSHGLLDCGDNRLPRLVRLLCTRVWPVLFQVLTLQHENPVALWGLNKTDAIDLLPAHTKTGAAIREFYTSLLAYYPDETSNEEAIKIIRIGIDFLVAAKRWWNHQVPR